jgi:hypothetical protein
MTVRINSAAFKAMAVGPEIRAACLAEAERAKAIAVGLAQEFRVSGEYADSFEVSDETIDWHGEYPGPRAAGRLTNTAPYAAAVEWGYEGRAGEPSSSAHHVLARTLDALGGG